MLQRGDSTVELFYHDLTIPNTDVSEGESKSDSYRAVPSFDLLGTRSFKMLLYSEKQRNSISIVFQGFP